MFRGFFGRDRDPPFSQCVWYGSIEARRAGRVGWPGKTRGEPDDRVEPDVPNRGL